MKIKHAQNHLQRSNNTPPCDYIITRIFFAINLPFKNQGLWFKLKILFTVLLKKKLAYILDTPRVSKLTEMYLFKGKLSN